MRETFILILTILDKTNKTPHDTMVHVLDRMLWFHWLDISSITTSKLYNASCIECIALILLARYNDESADKVKKTEKEKNRQLLLRAAFVSLSPIFLQCNRNVIFDHSITRLITSSSTKFAVLRVLRKIFPRTISIWKVTTIILISAPAILWLYGNVLCKVAHNHGFSLRNEVARWIRTSWTFKMDKERETSAVMTDRIVTSSTKPMDYLSFVHSALWFRCCFVI